MTIPLNRLPAPGQNIDEAKKAQDARAGAARQFEALLVKQLMSAMRSTAKNGGMMGSSGASGQFLSMFDDVFAEKVAEGGGIGLSRTLMQALGDKEGGAHTGPRLTGTSHAKSVTQPAPQALGVTEPLASLRGATAQLARAAYEISAPQGGKQWAKTGELSPQDLSSDFQTEAKDGVAHFNVQDAQGYKDSYKCNLFAFEAARRAGFEVPVVARARGWGFPTSNVVAEDASDGSLRGDWAKVVSPSEFSRLTDMLAKGEAAVMLVGSAQEGRAGHMAVVERIHNIETDASGNVKRIEFDGYEAREKGAQHLLRRSWNRYGSGEDVPLARNGFAGIQILALKRAVAEKSTEIPTSSAARASLKDFSSSSDTK